LRPSSGALAVVGSTSAQAPAAEQKPAPQPGTTEPDTTNTDTSTPGEAEPATPANQDGRDKQE
jgi:hypothetical protein